MKLGGQTGTLESPRGRQLRGLWERLAALDRSELGPTLGSTVLPFLLVLYLALKGGGYDAVARSEVGIAVWWIVLLGIAVSILPLRRVGRVAWIGVGLFALFTVWTGLGFAWSESAERTATEFARVTTYLGVFVLAVSVQGRAGLRRTVGAVGAAIGVIGVLALLSRFHPSWFPTNEGADFLRSSETRLNYPLNYWNGLSALMAIGVPLLLTIALQSRRIASRALAAGAIPALTLVMFYTLSRGGAMALAVALIVFMVLWPRRLAAIPYLAVTALGSALLIAAATQRDALEDGLTSQAALSQGDQMIAVALVVCAGVALLVAALGLADRHRMLPRIRVSRRTTAVAFAGVATAAIVAALAIGAPGAISDQWHEFQQSDTGPGETAERFGSASGTGRYQFWEAAVDANASEPLVGIGPGTFEFWYAQNGERTGFVRDAHSLYLETLAELGVIGLILLLSLPILAIVFALRRIIRAREDHERRVVAGALAAMVAFLAGAAVDWSWELAVMPVAFLLLTAAVLRNPSAERSRSSRRSPRSRRSSDRGRGVPIGVRVGAVALSAGALAVIAVPLAATDAVRESQAAATVGQLPSALTEAENAENVQPYAATPPVQRALVLEQLGQLAPAAEAARTATEEEPTNWRTWLTLSRIEAERGRAQASIEAYREARSLNPRSPLFNPPEVTE